MARPSLAWWLALWLAIPSVGAAQPPTAPTDPQVAAGIKQAEDGDYDGAIFTLDAVARNLEGKPDRASDLAQVYLYLGVSYLGKGHETTAKARFREAIASVHDLRIDSEKFAPKVVELFERAREEAGVVAAAPVPTPGPSAKPAPPAKGHSKTPWLLAGGAAVAGGVALAASGGGSSSGGGASTPRFSVVSADTVTVGTVGLGSGASFSSGCPTGEIVIGLEGRAGALLDAVAPECGRLAADGSISQTATLAMVGGTGGAAFVDTCPLGQAVVRVSGQGDASGLSSIAIQCAPVVAWVSSGTLGLQLLEHGGSSAGSYAHACPQGYVVNMLQGNASNYIYGIITTCVRIQRQP